MRQEDSWLPPLAAGEIPHWLGVILTGGRQVQTEEFQEGTGQHLGGKKLGVSLPQVP